MKVRLLCEKDIILLDKAFNNRSKKNAGKFQRYLHEQKLKKRFIAIVEIDNIIAGYSTLRMKSVYPPFKKNGTPEISGMCVLPRYRKHGYGAALIQFHIQRAQLLECKKIGLGVGLYKDYGAAQRLYAKFGFLPDGNGVTGYTDNGQKPEMIRFFKRTDTLKKDEELVMWLMKDIS